MTDRSVTVRLQAIVSGYTAKMAEATAATRAFGSQVATSVGGAAASTNKLGKAGMGLRTAMADPMAALVTPAGMAAGGLAITAKAAMDFESAWAGVTKTVEGSPAQLESIKEGIRDMAKEIPASTDEIAGVAEAAGQLGIQTPSILEFTRTMIDLGNTTNLSAQEGAESLARFANITEMSHDKFGNLGSTIVDLGNKFASTEAEITEFGLRIAGAGEIAGLNEAEILGIGTALSSVGVEAEAGGTAVQKVLLNITEAVETGSDKVEMFAEVSGMSAKEFAAAWRQDPAQAFVAFVEGLGKSGKGAIGILKELGLTDERLKRSFLALAGAGDLLSDSIETGNQAWSANSALSEEAAKRYETTAAELEVLLNNLKDLAITVGDIVLPILNHLIPVLQNVVEAAGDLVELDLSGFFADIAENVGDQGVNKIAGDFKALGSSLDQVSPALIDAASAEDKLRYNAYLATEGTGKLGGAAADLTDELDETEEAIKEVISQLEALFGIHIDAERASLRMADALADMRQSIDDSNGSLDAQTQKGRDARSAILDAADAAIAHTEALIEEGASTDRAAKVLQRHIDNLKADAVAAGASRNAVNDYIRELNLTPSQIRTLVELSGIDNARGQLRGLMGDLGAIDGWAAAATVTVTRVGSTLPVKHAGGFAGTSSARRLGGRLRSDEIATILQRGETVLSRSQGAVTPYNDSRDHREDVPRRGGVTEFRIEAGGRTLTRVVSTTAKRNRVLLGEI